MPYNIGNY